MKSKQFAVMIYALEKKSNYTFKTSEMFETLYSQKPTYILDKYIIFVFILPLKSDLMFLKNVLDNSILNNLQLHS